MATIETKYSVGDLVYHASTATERKQHPCPDCKGTRKWKAISPAGGEYSFPCPRCGSGYRANREMSLDYSAHVPSVRRLTVGSVQYNSAPHSHDSATRYMCLETGVGSGSIYDERKLFETEDAALAAAEAMAALSNQTTEWIVKQYDQALEISDYQLESAALKIANDAQLKARAMVYGMEDLFGTIAEADSVDDIRQAVEDYKEYDWPRDKAKADAEVSA